MGINNFFETQMVNLGHDKFFQIFSKMAYFFYFFIFFWWGGGGIVNIVKTLRFHNESWQNKCAFTVLLLVYVNTGQIVLHKIIKKRIIIVD